MKNSFPPPHKTLFAKASILKVRQAGKWGLCQFTVTERQISKVLALDHSSHRSFDANFTKSKNVCTAAKWTKPFCQCKGSISALTGYRTCPLLNVVVGLTGTYSSQ